MKILLSSSTLDRKNGYGNITFELTTALKNLGHEIVLLLPENDEFKENDIPGVAIKRILPPYIFRMKSKKILKYLFWRYKGKEKFDIVHSLFEFPYAPLLAREASRLKVPFVVGAQGTYGVQPLVQFPERYFMKYAYGQARAIHVPSEYTKNAILKESGEKYNISIIHNGVDLERFKEENRKESIRDKFPGKKILLTVGEIKSRKGQDLVIKALPEIIKKFPDVVYIMVGRESWKKYLVELAENLGVLENIFFSGPIPAESVIDYFYSCDIYVHTPRIHAGYQFEGFGIVYLEAGACGKPSIAVNAGGVSDAVVHNKTGLIGPVDDVESISENVLRLLEDESFTKQLGNSAKEYAEEHSWKNITDKYVKMYQNL